MVFLEFIWRSQHYGSDRNEIQLVPNNSTRVLDDITVAVDMSFLAQLVERVTSNDEVSRSSRLEGIFRGVIIFSFPLIKKNR